MNFTENISIRKENTITYKGFNNNTGRWETEEQNGAQTLPQVPGSHNFSSHASFPRQLLEEVLHQNERVKNSRKKKTKVPGNQGPKGEVRASGRFQ